MLTRAMVFVFAVTIAAHAVAQTDAKPVDDELIALYDKVEAAYMDGDVAILREHMRLLRLKSVKLDPNHRRLVMQMDKTARGFKPEKWWDNTKSPKNTSFKAAIWGKTFTANYMPTEILGVQALLPQGEYDRNGNFVVTKLDVVVSWRPNYVNKPDPLKGALAERHDLKVRHLGELIVWHELGHNYITTFLPVRTVVALYNQEAMAFTNLHEFYADMTAVYHSSPKASLAALMFRLDSLDFYDEMESHTRAAHGIGSLLLAEFLANPDKWPNVHFPPSVPDKQVELNTLIYIYEHFDPKWSVAEDAQLRTLVNTYLKRYGRKTLTTGGKIQLPNRLHMYLMAAQDREPQEKRDKWVAEQLEKIIKSGRADKLEEGKTIKWPRRGKDERRNVSWKIRDGRRVQVDGPPRIEIPW